MGSSLNLNPVGALKVIERGIALRTPMTIDPSTQSLPGSKHWQEIFRYKGDNGGQNKPQKPGKRAVLTAFDRNNRGG